MSSTLGSSTLIDSEYDKRQSGSTRFRNSTHTIPSPAGTKLARKQRWTSDFLRIRLAVPVLVLMIVMGVMLEVALAISAKQEGFAVPARNVIQIASTQFLLSVVPLIFVLPVAILYREMDWQVRRLWPYIMLDRGNAPAEESVLLDYTSMGYGSILAFSFKYKHYLVGASLLSAMATFILQPLASAMFQVQNRPQADDKMVMNKVIMDLNDDNLNSLLGHFSAAGFSEAAVFNNLTDPPFITGGWTTAEFVLPPAEGFNGTLEVDTIGIQTNPNCSNPTNQPEPFSNGVNTTISATNVDGCTVTLILEPEIAAQQYGVAAACGDELPVEQRPVMFWFYQRQGQNLRTIFCNPFMRPQKVRVKASLATGNLIGIEGLGDYRVENRIFGSPTNGRVHNGMLFDPSPDPNPFVQARAISISNGLPGAIFRLAVQSGLQSVLDNPNGFLDRTAFVYRQFLALSAKANYFVPVPPNGNNEIPAKKIALLPRLWINPLPGHLLALYLIGIGLAGIVIQTIFRPQHMHLMLTTPPSTIGGALAMTARSGFGELLLPYDNVEALEKKLHNLRFRFDRRTGAIVTESPQHFGATGWDYIVEDDASLSLLSPNQQQQHSVTAGAEDDESMISINVYPPKNHNPYQPTSPF